MTELRATIGRPWAEVEGLDWYQCWPVIDQHGIVHSVLDADESGNSEGLETRGITYDEQADVYRIDTSPNLTSVQAAEMLSVDRTTTQRAARNGEVQGAAQEPRPGSINAPWVATEHAWRTWYENRRSAGRPTHEAQIKALVGYHNYSTVGVFEAVELVSQRCPDGWIANYAAKGESLPEGAIQVGQTRVRRGDSAFVLYVHPKR